MDMQFDEFGNILEIDELGDNFDDDIEVEYDEGSEGEHDESLNYHYTSTFTEDPSLIRNIALMGQLHHGKTTFKDFLKRENPSTSILELTPKLPQEMTIMAMPVTKVMEDSNSKSYLVNIMDTPGHSEFTDELSAAFRLANGAILIVDAAEGVLLNTVKVIRLAIQEHLPIILVINKMDRLVELNLNPEDVYDKLRLIVEAVNTHISAAATDDPIQHLNPSLGNVCFATAYNSWCFTFPYYAKCFVRRHRISCDPNEFSSRLWGD